MNCECADVQAGFRKNRGTRGQIANIRLITENAREFQKNIYFYFIDYAIAFNCVDHNKLENSSRDGNTRPSDLHPEKYVCRSRSKQLELDMDQKTGSKSGKEYVKAVYCHPAYLTYMQSTSWEMLDWMKHKLESRLSGEKSITLDADYITLMAESKELKSLLMIVKEESEKVGLKLNIQKLRS